MLSPHCQSREPSLSPRPPWLSPHRASRQPCHHRVPHPSPRSQHRPPSGQQPLLQCHPQRAHPRCRGPWPCHPMRPRHPPWRRPLEPHHLLRQSHPTVEERQQHRCPHPPPALHPSVPSPRLPWPSPPPCPAWPFPGRVPWLPWRALRPAWPSPPRAPRPAWPSPCCVPWLPWRAPRPAWPSLPRAPGSQSRAQRCVKPSA
mmetsp:Transcript_14303/g.38573  ORF Transcript_14303/g.38573 Transcript_14303/m.38573 type:complete len:201 (+) Transcript_14303:584-1186(+)